MQRAGAAMTAGLTAPIVGIGAAAITMGNNFNDSLDKIVGLVGISRDQVNAWKGDILDLSKATAIGPEKLADAMFYITSAGLKGQNALDALKASATASVAGLGDVATVADAVTSAVNAYGQSNLSASKATDILTAAVREGKLDAASLAPVLGSVLPIASALGISFDQVAGTLAAMSRTGTAADEGATELTAIMSSLLKVTPAAAAALKGVGLTAEGLRQEAAGPNGLVNVMRTLNDAFNGNVDQMAVVIPNIRAFRGVMNLLAQDGSTVDSVLQGVSDSVGATGKAAQAVEEGPGFKFRKGINDLRVELVKLGDVLGPVISDNLVPAFGSFVSLTDKLVTAFQKLPEPAQTAIVVVAGIAAAVGPALIAIGSMASGISALATAMPILEAFGAALLTPPVGIVIALVAAGVAAYVFRDQIKDAFGKIYAAIKENLQKAWDWLKSNWPEVATLISGPFAPVVALATNAFGIRDALLGAFGEAKDKVSGAVGDIAGAIGDGFDSAVKAVEGFAKKLTAKNIGQAIGTALTVMILGPLLVLSIHFRQFFMQDLPSYIADAAKAVPKAGEKFVSAMGKLGGDAIDALWKGIQAYWHFVVTFWTETLPSAIKDAAPKIGEEALKVGKGAVDAIISGVSDLATKWGPAAVTALTNAVTSIATDLYNIGNSIVDGIWEGIKAAGPAFMKNVEDFAKGIVSGVGGALHVNSPSKDMIPIGKAIPEGLAVGIQQGSGSIGAALGSVLGGLQSQVDNAVASIGGSTSGISLLSSSSTAPQLRGVALASGPGGGTLDTGVAMLASGLDYVPYDMFPAFLHEGERVLTKAQAQQNRQGQNNGSINVNTYGPVNIQTGTQSTDTETVLRDLGFAVRTELLRRGWRTA